MVAATQETYNRIKTEGLANGNTPDETQDTSGIRLCYAWKGYRSRASIYERQLPDKLTTALCLDGPVGADNALTFHNDGRITLMTGARDPNLGASSGRLNISTFGGLHRHLGRVNMTFSEGDETKPTADGQALNIYCSGDYVEETKGGERFIKAEKILIEATSELVIKGGSVKIQSDSDIEMAASAINTAQINKKDIVLGQQMSFGAGEETTVQFDPRANQSVVSPGHINRVIAGDYKKFVGGVSNVTVAGGTFAVPFVKDRSATYSVKSVLGNISTNALVGATLVNSGGAYTNIVGGAAVIAASGAATMTAGGIGTFAASGNMNVSGGGATTLSGVGATTVSSGAAVAITATADVSITGANVRLTGALIYLN